MDRQQCFKSIRKLNCVFKQLHIVSKLLFFWWMVTLVCSVHHFGSERWNRLQRYCVQTFVLPRGWILMTLLIPWLSLQRHYSVFSICCFEWNVWTNIGCIVIKCETNIHVHHRINCSKFSDLLTFHIEPSSGHKIDLCSTLV